MSKYYFDLIIFLLLAFNAGVVAQTAPALALQDSLLEQPPFKLFRAEENYDYLKAKEKGSYKADYLDAIKFIGLNASESINISLPYTFNPPKIRESSLKIGKKFEGHA